MCFGRLGTAAQLEDNPEADAQVVDPATREAGRDVIKLENADGDAPVHLHISATTQPQREAARGARADSTQARTADQYVPK